MQKFLNLNQVLFTRGGINETRFKKILRRKLNEYNTQNGTNVTEEALINSLKQSGNYPDFDGGMIR